MVIASGENPLSFLQSFGVEWDMLASQAIMFALLSAILYKFVFKPVIKKADERRAAVEKGLADAEESAKRLEACQKACEEKIAAAAKEASGILSRTRDDAKAMLERAEAAAAEKSAQIAARAKGEIEAERAKMRESLKGEIAELVVKTAEAVLSGALDDSTRAKIASAAAKKLEK